MLSGTAPMEMMDALAAASSRAIRLLSLIASPSVVVPVTVPRGFGVEFGRTGLGALLCPVSHDARSESADAFVLCVVARGGDFVLSRSLVWSW